MEMTCHFKFDPWSDKQKCDGGIWEKWSTWNESWWCGKRGENVVHGMILGRAVESVNIYIYIYSKKSGMVINC